MRAGKDQITLGQKKSCIWQIVMAMDREQVGCQRSICKWSVRKTMLLLFMTRFYYFSQPVFDWHEMCLCAAQRPANNTGHSVNCLHILSSAAGLAMNHSEMVFIHSLSPLAPLHWATIPLIYEHVLVCPTPLETDSYELTWWVYPLNELEQHILKVQYVIFMENLIDTNGI